jgi:hypothetical protein
MLQLVGYISEYINNAQSHECQTVPLSLQHDSSIQSLYCVMSCDVLCLLSLLYPTNDIRLIGSFITKDNRNLRTTS